MNEHGCWKTGGRAAWLALSLLTQAWAAERLALTCLAPAEGSEVAPDVLIVARISEDGRPFTEAGQRRWAQAVVFDQKGQPAAQVPLRDHGRGHDRERGDGEWSATSRLLLQKGSYRLRLIVQRGEERFSRECPFAVSAAAQQMPAERLSAVEARLAKLATLVEGLPARLPPPKSQAPLWALLLSVVLAAWLGMGIAWAVWLRRRAPAVSSTSGPAPPAEAVASAKWRSLFDSLKALETTVAEIRKDLSGTFQAHRRLSDQQAELAGELVGLLQSLASVETLSAPHTRALQSQLDELLRRAGVERWVPVVGDPAPPECEQRPDTSNPSAPPFCVTQVLRPGFRMRQGEEWVTLVRPVVAVATRVGREGKP
jgi:hypothetical protein